MDSILFRDARDKIVGTIRIRCGIGTLQEKTVHAVIKHYLAPEEWMHEMPVTGYVADIFTGKEIIEIQTGGFNKLRFKLNAFLNLYPVTVVYPIPYEKWLIWIEEETGEYSQRRKSPKKGNPYMVFPELYKIKNFLSHPNFSLKLLLIDMEEYRLLNGWSKDKKKGSVRFDRIPMELIYEIDLIEPRDYMQLIPEKIVLPFSVKDFAKITAISQNTAQTTLHILHYIGVLERVGKKGNSFLYMPQYE